VLALADGLRARDITVLPAVFSGGEGWLSERLRSAGFAVFTPSISRATPIDVSTLHSIARWSREERVDVLHAHELMMAVYAGGAGVLTRTPHMITMHGGVRFASALHRRWALKASAHRSSALIGVSDSTCDHLASTLGLPRASINLVPNGVPFRAGQREQTRRELGVLPDETLLLAVGNLYKVKGHATLVQAAELLARHNDLPPWRIAVAGRGEEEAALRAMISSAGLSQRVELLGLRSDIPDLLAAADGWLMPSLSEGLPMALLEAMLAGLPTVCSAVGGIPDLIRPGDTGFLVPPEDANALADGMSRLLRGRTEARVLGERARAYAASHYSIETMVESYMKLYKGSLQASRRSS
jgi:glycosyltransferase involved in cell wall biosynthesis